MNFIFLTYIDPGTGSIIIQVIIASVLGSLFFIKVFFRKIADFFKNLFSMIFGKKNGEK